jgi:hypothetical protein
MSIRRSGATSCAAIFGSRSLRRIAISVCSSRSTRSPAEPGTTGQVAGSTGSRCGPSW